MAKAFEPGREIGGVNLELVPIRVEKVERLAVAVILLPGGDAGSLEAVDHGLEEHGRDGEGEVGVLRQRAGTRLGVEREAEPVAASQEVGAFVPARDRL